jgi:hypothetical protein
MLWLSEPDQQFFLRPELYNRSARCLTGSLPKGQGNVMKTAYYQAAVEFARELLHVLAPLGPQDMIDIQGFIWAIFSHSRLWFGGKTYGGTKDMLPEFLRRQVYAVHFAPRPPVAELLKGITSLDKAGRKERRAAIERQLTTDKEKKALLGFFDLACASNSLLLAKSVWYNHTRKLSLMRISGVCRTGNTVTFDEELGHQLSVTWLTTPDRVLTLGEHFPQVSHTLTSLPIEEALDILALEEPTDLRETGSARQLPLTSLEEEDEERVPEPPPPPLQPVYTVKDFRRETRFPASETERWLGRLRRKMQVILQGPPGTGKTFLAERLARIIVSGARGFWDILQFHPSYGYEDFMQGIRPRVISGQLTYGSNRGGFCTSVRRPVQHPTERLAS